MTATSPAPPPTGHQPALATSPRAVGVVVPARDEADRLAACLESVLVAAERVDVPVTVVVALDRCTDRTGDVARRVLAGTPSAVVDVPAARTVAAVRTWGTGSALSAARALTGVADELLWTAHTDADTTVPVDWLSTQLQWAADGADVVAGFVRLDDDPDLPGRARSAYDGLLRSRLVDEGHHRHVYGANLGVRASVLARLGGFPDVAVGEERALVDAAVADGLRVVRPVDPCVTTSGRRRGRATGGLADLLDGLAG
ncbi:glycosyltransferase family 2 protein [Thalassiella azotivora]